MAIVSSSEVVEVQQNNRSSTRWRVWLVAIKQVLPLYVAIHVAFLVLTVCALVFLHGDYFSQHTGMQALAQLWSRKDVGWYLSISRQGYTDVKSTAFFPLYPLLLRLVPGHDFMVGLLISNGAWLVLMIVLYQLVREEFGNARADRTILYLCIFPTAFFFFTAYTESLFLCLVVLSFYAMRHNHWWLAGLFGFFAGLTRSAGVFLAVPFVYEYARQHQFRLRALRLDAVSFVLIPLSVALFAGYCAYMFGDALAFSHAQIYWSRSLDWPWTGPIEALMHSRNLTNFESIRNLLDLVCVLFVLVLLIVGSVGPWRFERDQWSYLLLGWVFFLFVLFVPVHAYAPLQSMPRFMLEVFPAFIVLAGLKSKWLHLHYVVLAGALLFVQTMLFLTGHWIV